MNETRKLKTEADVHELAETLIARLGEGWQIEFGRLSITQTQNNSLHRWLDELAKRLNDAGLGVRGLLKLLDGAFEVPWSTSSAKEILYRPAMEAMTGKTSTTDLDTVEPSDICQKVGKRVSEVTGITAPPWPDRFNNCGRNG